MILLKREYFLRKNGTISAVLYVFHFFKLDNLLLNVTKNLKELDISQSNRFSKRNLSIENNEKHKTKKRFCGTKNSPTNEKGGSLPKASKSSYYDHLTVK